MRCVRCCALGQKSAAASAGLPAPAASRSVAAGPPRLHPARPACMTGGSPPCRSRSASTCRGSTQGGGGGPASRSGLVRSRRSAGRSGGMPEQPARCTSHRFLLEHTQAAPAAQACSPPGALTFSSSTQGTGRRSSLARCRYKRGGAMQWQRDAKQGGGPRPALAIRLRWPWMLWSQPSLPPPLHAVRCRGAPQPGRLPGAGGRRGAPARWTAPPAHAAAPPG